MRVQTIGTGQEQVGFRVYQVKPEFLREFIIPEKAPREFRQNQYELAVVGSTVVDEGEDALEKVWRYVDETMMYEGPEGFKRMEHVSTTGVRLRSMAVGDVVVLYSGGAKVLAARVEPVGFSTVTGWGL